MYKIEKEVPIPRKNLLRRDKYPIAEMQVGDSFVIPEKGNEERERKRHNVANTIARHRGTVNKGFGYTTRSIEEGLRVWRTK